MKKRRMIPMSLDMSKNLYAWLENLAYEEKTTMADMIRRGLSVVIAYDRKRKEFPHIGFASDPQNLDVLMVGVLNY